MYRNALPILHMKKVCLLFSIILLAFVLNGYAQSAIADSTQTYSLAVNDPANSNIINPEAITAKYVFKGGIYQKITPEIAEESKQPFPSVTDNELQACLNKHIAEQIVFANADTLNQHIAPQKPVSINNLKRQISLVTNDTMRAAYYQKLADYYLKYDSISTRRTRQNYQDAAIEYTIKALHAYSSYNDTPGLINSFDNLVRVYRDQKKFSQAKWFILQANTMARQRRDAPKIISTLITLANIKMSIKDYKLAQRDLNEALSLSTSNHMPQMESIVQQNYYVLYTRLNNTAKATKALKRRDAIEDSLIKAAEARELAKMKTQDSLKQAKKKLYTSVSKKSLKASSGKKQASL